MALFGATGALAQSDVASWDVFLESKNARCWDDGLENVKALG